MSHRSAALALVLLLVAAPHAQQAVLPPAVRSAADAITAAELKRDLEFFASDELRGRNTPSPGFDRAAKHIAERLQQAGVSPMGDRGGYFQQYEMHETRVVTENASLDIGDQRFPFGEGFVMRSLARPVSGALPVVYVGHGWTVPDRGIDPYAAVDVRGKLVVAHGPRALPRGVAIQQIGRVSAGGTSVVVEAATRGAAGLLYIPHGNALDNWDAMRSQNVARRELEPPVPSAYAAAGVTSVLLSRAAAEALLAGEAGAGPDLRTRAAAGDFPASFQLSKTVTLNVPVTEPVIHHPYNVVATIEGADPALRREYITVEAHLDGAVGTRAVDGDDIYNSADDNATGSAALLRIAEQLMKAPRPKRSIIFIWDSGEEQGLWGTRHFVANPPVPLSSIVAHFNIDMIGANRAPGAGDASSPEVTGPNEVYLTGPGVLSAKADALLERVNQAYLGMRFNRAFDRPDHEFFYPRTDAGPFLERGILTIGFFTGIHRRYHQPSDETQFLDPQKMETIARTAFAAIWAFADAEERPGIDKPIPPLVPRHGSRR